MQPKECEHQLLEEARVLLECGDDDGWRYRLISSMLYHPDIGRYQSYGMELWCESTGERAILPDLSQDREAVLTFFFRCVKGGVTSDHLLEVAEDFLEDLYGLN